MINIDKDYLITVDLKNTKVKSDKTIFFYNTDLNICNIFIKLICSDKDKTIPEDLIVEFAVLKPETDEFKPLDATLISKEDLLYQVDLTTDYLDIIGTYECEIRVSGTIDNETKCFTSESFDYVVKPNITAKLNNQIKQDKNLPILEKLIKEVNDIGLGIEMNQVQLKRDDNLVGDNKSIVGAINQLREDVNSGGKVELTDYQKKTDDNLATEEKSIVGAVNEINSKTITLEKDDTSFNGVDDTIHDNLTTTDKRIIGAINEVNAQYKDIANYSLTKGTDGKVYIKKQDGTLIGDGIEVGSNVDLSKISMSMDNQTLKLMNDGTQIATVEIPTATVTDEKLISIIQTKIDDGTLSSATIADKSVTTKKLADDVCNNLVQISKTEINNLISIEDFIKTDTGLYSKNGNEYSSTGTMITDFIPIKNNTKYGFYNIAKLGVYDADKKFIEFASSSPYTTPTTAAYFKCEALMSSTIIYLSTNIKNANLLRTSNGIGNVDKLITTSILNPKILKYNDFSNIFNIDKKYINLIDESKKIAGKLSDDGYTVRNGDSYTIINFTKLEKDKTYTFKSSLPIINMFFYDEDYTFLVKKSVNLPYDSSVTFTLNEEYLGMPLNTGTVYIRISLSYANTEAIFGGSMLVEGSIINKYAPYGDVSNVAMNNIDKILEQILNKKHLLKLQGKKWVAHGDSITYYSRNYEQYVEYANNYLYCDLTNLGNPGTTMALRNSETVDAVTDKDDKLSMAYLSSVTDYSKYDVCTIFFGTNDMSSNVPIGTVDSTDEKTYLGALNKSIQRMYASNHKLKILLITPIYRIEETNLGLDAYRTALNDFGKKHGIPVINMHELCNINAFNSNGTLLDGLHPTGTGAEHIGAVLAGEMLRYF